MTSPYLQRPKRSLHQALIDTGRAPQDLGLEAPASKTGVQHLWSGTLVRFSRNRATFAFVALLAVLAGAAVIALQSPADPPIAEITDPSALNDIAPAAGPASMSDPNQPAANIETWGDAPSLEAPIGAPVSTD